MQQQAPASAGAVFPLNPTREYPTLVRGAGIHVYDQDGKEYIDAIAGIAVALVGHGEQRVAETIGRQAGTLTYCISNIFSNQPAEDLARRLGALTPDTLQHFLFTSGGSEATEVAIKLARQYYLARGQERHVVIGRWQSYHGATLGALSATGHRGRRAKFEPLLLDFPHIEPNYCYRCPFGKIYPDCALECATALETAIQAAGPERVAAFIAEPIVGAAAGATVPPPEYFPIIREICDRYDVLFIADEVITGFGRTGQTFGLEHWSVTPDLMTMAKGISGGYAPLGAVAVSDRVWSVFAEQQVTFDHIFTYAANPLSATVGSAVLDILVEDDLVQRSAARGEYLFAQAERWRKHAIVGDIRGRGLLLGVELVADRATKEPFPPEIGASARLAAHCFERGLVIYPGSGCVDGVRGDHFLLCPPLVVTEAQLDRIVELLDQALAATARELASV